MTSFSFTLPIPPGTSLLVGRYGVGAPIVFARKRFATITKSTPTTGDDGAISLVCTAELEPSVETPDLFSDTGHPGRFSIPRRD